MMAVSTGGMGPSISGCTEEPGKTSLQRSGLFNVYVNLFSFFTTYLFFK